MLTFDKTPTEWIAGWSEDGTNVTFPIASIPELTAAEADGTTGDIRKILFALMHKLAAVYATIPVAERPVQFQFFPSAGIDTATNNIQRTYTIRFNTGVTGEEVLDEPA